MDCFWCLCMIALPVVFMIFDWWKRRAWVEGLHRKAVLITGCDSGFGYAAARSLYTRGVLVYAGCYTKEGADKLQQETGERLKTLILDVSTCESVQKAFNYVKETLPKSTEFWGVVNNAGVPGQSGPVEFNTRADVQKVFDVNVFGMMDITNAFLPLLKHSRGRVVNVASMAAEFPFPGMMPYCASKHAARGYSETLRVEKSIWGIKVSTIEPAFFKTNIIDAELYTQRFKEKWEQLDQTMREEYGEDFMLDTIKNNVDIVTKAAQPNLVPVVDAFEHALFSVCPRKIYYPGLQAKWMKNMPTAIMERMVQYGPLMVYPKVLKDKM